jgi:hypothetical protein
MERGEEVEILRSGADEGGEMRFCGEINCGGEQMEMEMGNSLWQLV